MLPRLHAIFFAIFHPVEGPRVVFQMPEDTFVDPKRPQSARSQRPLNLDFSAVFDYIIPKGPLCGRLITCYAKPQARPKRSRLPHMVKVLGLPTMIEQTGRYQRNHFIFNLCFVFDERADTSAYEPIVRKCARVFRALEEETWFLSKIENLPRLHGIVEQLYEDLNAYYETFIALPEEVSPPVSQENPAAGASLLDVDDLDAYIARASGPSWRAANPTKLPAAELYRSADTPIPNSSGDADDALADDERDSDSSPIVRMPRSFSGQSRGELSAGPSNEPQHSLLRTVRDAINLKLFPTYPNPPEVRDWDVPVLTIDLANHFSGSWDLTLVRLIPFIDGVSHTRRIAQLAEVDLELTRQCIQHLLYYSYAVVIDIFQYSNMYAVRPQIASIADVAEIGIECAEYVSVPGHPVPTVPTLMRMYSMLRQGRMVSDWIEELGQDARSIDVRRLVTFGVINGFLRRVHRYPYLTPTDMDATAESEADWPRGSKTAPLSVTSAMQRNAPASRDAAEAWLRATGEADGPSAQSARKHERPRAAPRRARRAAPTALNVNSLQRPPRSSSKGAEMHNETITIPPVLPALLNGQHCDDELCVRFAMSWPELHRVLQWLGSPFAHASVALLAGPDGPAVQAEHVTTARWTPDRLDLFATRTVPSRVKIISV